MMRLRLGGLFGAALLRDMFLTPSPFHGGFERVLRRRAKQFRRTPTNRGNFFPHKSGSGPQEMARRRRHMEKRSMVRGKQLISGDTALLRFVEPDMVHVQFDNPGHDYAHGWHAYPAREFEVLA